MDRSLSVSRRSAHLDVRFIALRDSDRVRTEPEVCDRRWFRQR